MVAQMYINMLASPKHFFTPSLSTEIAYLVLMPHLLEHIKLVFKLQLVLGIPTVCLYSYITLF